MNAPRLAVVGHPNKGKSSLVATLAADDGVPVAPESGTTQRGVAYPMRSRGQVLYELVDTPGFQRARRALAWLQAHATSAAERSGAVQAFVEAHRDAAQFRAEVELLTPIVEGAGIIYVVDGAVPYGAEYEAEMEILRWSGRPSIAVINPIGGREHVQAWHDALGQFFRVVREVDVLSAPLEQRLDLLRAFGELDPLWRPHLERAVEVLREQRASAKRRAAQIVSELLVDALTLAPSRTLAAEEDVDAARGALEEDYRARLRGLEHRARDRVEQTYQHRALSRSEKALAIVEADLFAEQTWELFGLSRTALAGIGATGGAAAGLGVDAALGGLSMFLGSAIGAVTGGAAAWFGAAELASIDRETLPLGEQVLRVRAGANRNLPFVLLGRARAHHALVARRSHARREPLVVGDDGHADGATRMDEATRKRLSELFIRITGSGDEPADSMVTGLVDTIEALLEADLQ